MATSVLDVFGLAGISAGVGTMTYGWIVVWNVGPVGFVDVARGGGLVAAGLALLAVSWLKDRHAFAGTHRRRL